MEAGVGPAAADGNLAAAVEVGSPGAEEAAGTVDGNPEVEAADGPEAEVDGPVAAEVRFSTLYTTSCRVIST